MVRRLLVSLAALALVGANSSRSVATFASALPAGTAAPRVNGACLGSPATYQLGTDNIGQPDNVKSTTIVNIWGIERAADSSVVGYVIKTFNGWLWYLPPVPMPAQSIADNYERAALLDPSLKIIGCFTHDLPLAKGDY